MQTGALVGRQAELDEAVARTKTNRLVTIVGPGGVGKTALARALADRVVSTYPMGVRQVDLARIDDDDAVPGALAAQLGFDSFDGLLSSPSDRPMMLVVDNCEHVLDACASAVAQILGACRQPVVVATSRAPLELPGESIVSLAPLAVPTLDADPAASPSVQLCLQRIRDAGGSVDDDELGEVAELCRRLDGLPLAIEIAAARTRTMAVAEIRSRLDETIDVLDRPRFRGDPRHRSITVTIRWSHDLLADGPARLLERLAVFTGPFTADRGRALAEDDSFDTDLDELVNASLVVLDERSTPTKYRLLDTIRRFGIEELRRRGTLGQAYDRFVDQVLASVTRIVEGSTSTWRPSLVRDLEAEYDDIAEALNYVLAHDDAPDRAYRLCGIMWAIVHQGHADDIVVLCRRTLQRWPADDSSAAMRTVAALATAEYVTGHPAAAAELAAAAIDGERRHSMASITLYRSLGQARRALGDLDGSVAAFRAGATIGHQLEMTAMALELDIAAALVTADLGDVSRGVSEVEAVLAGAEAMASVITASWARTALGWMLLRRDTSAARVVIDQALDEARRIDYPIAIAVGLRSRAFAELLDGRLDESVDILDELADELLRRGALSNVRLLTDVSAATAFRCGNPSWERLAATARALPITTLAAAHFELIELPPTTSEPLARHEVVATIRHVVAELRTGRADVGSPPSAVPNIATSASINRLGDVCEFAYLGRTVAVRSTKGVADIVRLIEANGAELHCLDLAGAAVEESSTGETIDATARRQYEQRIRDLQDEIDEAEANSDYARAYQHQDELDQLIEHLTVAIGHGGRTRRAGGSTERARSAVTHRVKATIRQITKLHPQLGRHLAHSVSTGAYFSYRPEHPTVWQVS